MIQQLVQRLMSRPVNPLTREQAALTVLGADPFDLLLHIDQVWNRYNPWAPNPPPAPVGGARASLWALGVFKEVPQASGAAAWDHLGYSYVLENTRAVQIIRRVVAAYRTGESLGIPSVATQRWLDATETLLFGASNPVSLWLSTSAIRDDPESVRRNAYWRLFGLDLAFAGDGSRTSSYEKTGAANTTFLPLFNELLFELWQAMSNLRNTSGVNQADDDRIFRISEELGFVLRSRRQNQLLAREELAAATALGWIELTLSADTPVVADLRATATNPADRLRLMGERVGLSPHSKSPAFFSMASELSVLLRAIEGRWVTGPEFSGLLYRKEPLTPVPGQPTPAPIGVQSRRVITEWAVATGADLKTRSKPVQVSGTKVLAAVR